MSDYSKTTNFTAKDSLNTGDANKLIKGVDHDTEYDNIAIASATKYDSNDLASLAEAQAESSNTKLMTPLRTANWADANGGIVGDLQALADPNADTLLGWDDSANVAIGFTLHASLLHAGTQLSVDHDAATNFVANEHIDHTSVSMSTASNSGLSGGGTIAATRTLSMNLANLVEFGLGDLLLATDEFVLSDGGTTKRVDYQHLGLRIVNDTSSRTLTIADANSVLVAQHASVAIVYTIPANSVVAYQIGTFFHVIRNDAAEVDVAVTSDTHVSPLGKSPRANGSMSTIIKIAATTWVQAGDVKV